MKISNLSSISFKDKTKILDKNYQNLYQNNGITTTQNGELYSDVGIVVDKDGRILSEFLYDCGRMILAKNYQTGSEKIYEYGQNFPKIMAQPIGLENKETIYDVNYFQYPRKTTKITTTKPNCAPYSSYLYKNPSAKYSGEVDFAFLKNNLLFKTKLINAQALSCPFKNPKSAKQFFFKNYGIKIDYIKDMKEAIFLYQALEAFCGLEKNQKGKKLFDGLDIIHFEYDEDDELYANAVSASFDLPDEIAIKKDAGELTYEDLKNVPNNKCLKTGKPHIEINRNYRYEGCELRALDKGETKSGAFYLFRSFLVHELAHILHMNTLSAKELLLVESLIFDENEEKAALKVSDYATIDGCEFVAEYIAGKLEGRTYDDDVDELYKKCLGPKIF